MCWRFFRMAFLVAAALAGWGVAWKEHQARIRPDDFSLRRLALLDTESARLTNLLAEQAARLAQATDAGQQAAIEKEVASLRDLAFVRPVVYKEIPRSELPTILRQKLFQQMPDREFDDAGVALTALGLLPPGIDLKQTYLALLGEQIGAFYDQHTREVFTFSGQPLSNAQNRVILAHELTHALEDQHFHLENLPLEAKGNDDRTLAASALVEGDATLVMNRFMLGHLSGAVLKETLASAFTTDVRQLAAAPRFLRETLLFPYLKGQVFCEGLYARGGWAALAEAFRDPPSCTAQILHPERFLARPRWEPETVRFPTKTAVGEQPLVENVVGEFGVRQLLKSWLRGGEPDELAASWTADRYLVYGSANANSYLWHTQWSSAAAAERFAAAATDGWRQRYAAKLEPAAGAKTAAGSVSSRLSATRLPSGRELRIVQAGRAVALIEAQDMTWAAALLQLVPAAPMQNDHTP